MTPKEYEKKILQAKRFEQTRVKGVKNWKAKIILNGEVRIKPVSETRARENSKYSRLKKIYLNEKPECEIRMSPFCNGLSVDIHHKQRRRTEEQRMNTDHWLGTCRPCHMYLHSHEKEARELGFIENGLK